jgi:DNA-binding response OmpR family regulator
MEVRRRWPETYILAISGGGMIGAESHLSDAAELGANHTMTKPIDRAEFLTHLAAAFERLR